MDTNGTDSVFAYEDYAEDEKDGIQVREYDITSTPNDFNVLTLFNFIESGAIVIPGFQRHFVWDIRRASKLIESLILGLPVPQIFLYEQGRNKFLVIDGQQRLMSIYYFIKQRFPKKENRAKLREVFETYSKIPDKYLHNDDYFTNFRLVLPGRLPEEEDIPNPLSGKSYETLAGEKFQLNLRPIRNVVVRQNLPRDDDSSIYEIFSRLNSGGMNLAAQEIRMSLFHSPFYEMLMKLNLDRTWRTLLSKPNPDLHLKDIEVLLRSFAMLIDRENYSSSMVKFLNQFSKKAQDFPEDKNEYLKDLFLSFLRAAEHLPEDAFSNRKTGRFSLALLEAVFTAASEKAYQEKRFVQGELNASEISELARNEEFQEATVKASTKTANVLKRIELGKSYITSL